MIRNENNPVLRTGRTRQRALPAILLAALTAGLLTACPRNDQPPPPNPDGSQPRDYREMINRVHQRNAYNQSLDTVKQALQRFQVELGRLPTNLFELVRYQYLEDFPKEVPPGYTYGYDAVRGFVTFMKEPEGDGQTPSP